jgi:transcriptional regulator with XRE-family HTH domain
MGIYQRFACHRQDYVGDLMSQKFGERLRVIREQRKMTQDELSRRSNINPSQICFFETNSRMPSFDNLVRLADALNCSLDLLCSRVDRFDIVMSPMMLRLLSSFEILSIRDQEVVTALVEQMVVIK